MTGRDLIIYILSNNLEDKKIYENGRLLGFMSPIEAAVKFEVGEATVRTWCAIGALPCVRIEGRYFIPALAERPFKGGSDVQTG